MRQSLEHGDHIGEPVEAVDGVHGPRIVCSRLHIANNRIAIRVVALAAVELAREAVQPVSGRVHIRPTHSQRQVRAGKRTVDHTPLEARHVATRALAIATKASDGVKDGGVLRIEGVGVDAPVPVGLRSLEAALRPEEVLVELDVPAVPGEEVCDKVDVGVEGEVGVDEVVHARCDGVDGGIFCFGEVA